MAAVFGERYAVLTNDALGTRAEADRAVRPESPLGATRSLGRRNGLTFRTMTAARTQAPEVATRVETVATAAEAIERRRKGNAMVARGMPTVLIKPRQAAGAGADIAWGLKEVGALDTDFDGEGVTVAVLDTGIDRNHAAFDGMDIVEKDFTGEGNGDPNGHGTHCCGTIFGRDVNGVRIGIAPKIRRALVGKILGADGSGDTVMLFNAIMWALGEQADVISLSLGMDFPGYAKQLTEEGLPQEIATSRALSVFTDNLRLLDGVMQQVRALAAFERGAVIVAASGNESRADENPTYRLAAALPAAAEGAISVGALGRSEGGYEVAAFSNAPPRLSAPGVDILSAKSGTKRELHALSGTSMAAPHVAGVAALWWQQLRQSPAGATPEKVERKLLSTVRTTGFSDKVNPLDRGDGIVTAPPRAGV